MNRVSDRSNNIEIQQCQNLTNEVTNVNRENQYRIDKFLKKLMIIKK